MVDDTGFAKDGSASPCVARQYSGTLGKVGNCQIGVSVHLVNERASCAADWRLFCPESWDDATLGDLVAAARAKRRRERVGIPGHPWPAARPRTRVLHRTSCRSAGSNANCGTGSVTSSCSTGRSAQRQTRR